ncbi:hypothetical protein FNF29_07466 [Cafeteria roenbergensis]|uniref:Endonuclease/exonuclease/phosphatase domain-containing protein n=1 Tax=Cafeteria roenbergensis TaxID=33653 RepID=A0A5A8DE51_CAFRO|nr:hypothetical protein FNF29_07466 [Cafeteria roenbergensis]KAA0163528.1 hypothetical protein FNF28_04185 [Cafeteria roenbergensis]|eukprot:KAA0147297.1 hypothetical protein FNF29_07466 [Cafeteria roenbergensis]
MAASVPGSSAGGVRHSLVTYNILSEALCDTGSFKRYSPADVDVDVRWGRIESKLRSAMEEQCVLMLQEVSLEWASRIAVLCAQMGYMPIWRCYGSDFSNHMGVALLVPTAKYDVRRVRMARVGKELEHLIPRVGEPCPPETKPSATMVSIAAAVDAIGDASWWVLPPVMSRPVKQVWRAVKRSVGIFRKEDLRLPAAPRDEPWKEARTRHNAVVYASLVPKEDPSARPLGVAVYHMPCRFRGIARGVMTLHTWSLAKTLHRWASEDGADPVLGADFNFKPADRQYRLLATGSLLTEEEEAAAAAAEPSFVEDDPRGSSAGAFAPKDPSDFDGRLPAGLRLTSAYKAVHGAEPDFTNYNFADMVGDEPFIDALDFIWVGDGLRAVAAPALPSRTDDGVLEAGPYPSEAEPSDHVMVRADVVQV